MRLLIGLQPQRHWLLREAQGDKPSRASTSQGSAHITLANNPWATEKSHDQGQNWQSQEAHPGGYDKGHDT